MLTVKQAHSLIRLAKLKAIKCFEYKSVYVFKVVPENFDMTKSTDGLLDCLRSVNKQTGEIRSFTPFDISAEEYKKGKQITNFK